MEAASPIATIVHSDISVAIRDAAVKYAFDAIAANPVEKDAAAAIKRSLESAYGGCWHVCVGSSFGCSISHHSAACALFKLGKIAVLVFQTFEDASLVLGAGKKGSRSAGAGSKGEKESKKTDEDEEDA